MNPIDRYVELMAECSRDPYKFVIAAYPWGEPGTILANRTGPRKWQKRVLEYIRDNITEFSSVDRAIRYAVTSGHGSGKSALVTWLCDWAMKTMAKTRGVITANTAKQLETKTWAEMSKWFKMSVGSQFFELTATSYYAKEDQKDWRLDATPWSIDNTDAFAGLHNLNRRILLIFDEASGIDDKIWEVAGGALTDVKTQILWLVFGNPSCTEGAFRECFRRYSHRWEQQQIDCRELEDANLSYFQSLAEDYGEDSDYFRVRVRGMFPLTDASGVIAWREIEDAAKRGKEREKTGVDEEAIMSEARIIGCDVAHQGDDTTVIAKRHGRSLTFMEPMAKFTTVQVANVLTATMADWEADAAFVDGTGGYGAGVVDYARTLNFYPTPIHFSSSANNPKLYFNRRSEMIWELIQWVKDGGAIPDDKEFKEELSAVKITHKGDLLRVCDKDSMKDTLGRSPDKLDAAALTFASKVAPLYRRRLGQIQTTTTDWDPNADV